VRFLNLVFTGTCEKCRLFGLALWSFSGAVGTRGKIISFTGFYEAPERGISGAIRSSIELESFA
jgi:hypothetical protein